jgi:hypothetical protein
MSKFVEYLLPLEYAVARDASAVTTTSYLVDVMLQPGRGPCTCCCASSLQPSGFL